MSLIQVERYKFTPDWSIGRIKVKEKPVGFSIEDEIRQVKLHGETAIPFGAYKLGFRQSPKFSDKFWWSDSQKILVPKSKLQACKHIKDLRPHDLIWLLDVPNFQYVLIHWGNFDDDTEGCLIVGSAIGFMRNKFGEMKEAVINSQFFYKTFYEMVYPIIKEGNQTILITQAK